VGNLLLKITGPNVTPESVSVDDLCKYLELLQKAIRAESPTPESASVSLVRIRKGSNSLAFCATPAAERSYCSIITKITGNRLEDINLSAHESLYEMQQRMFAKDRAAMLRFSNEASLPRLVISPKHPIPAPPAEVRISGTTSLFGRCIQVGGATPKVVLLAHDGNKHHIEVSEDDAKRFAKNLYEEMTIEGTAEWDAKTLEIISFRVSEMHPYRSPGLVETFKDLAKMEAGRWKGVNAEEFVKSMRE